MKRFRVLTGICLTLLLAMVAQNGFGTVPSKINIQGVLRDALGAPISGTVDLTLKVYTLETGSPVLLYTEMQPGVTVTNGLFNLLLGNVGSIPDSIVNHEPLELGISVNSGAELPPRIRLVSVPFARAASRINGDIETRPGTIEIINADSASLHLRTVDGGGIHLPQVNVTTTSSRAHLAVGDLTGDGLADIVAKHDSTRIIITNLGSSGQDGVSIVSRDSGTTLEMSSRLNGLPPGEPVIGTLRLATNDSKASVAIGDLDRDGLLDMVATNDSSRLSITNIGSSGQDGVDINTDDNSSSLAVRTFKGYAIVETDDDGNRISVHNIGSSGQDGVSIASRDSGTTFEMSSRLNGLPPGEPVFGTLTMTTNDSSASVSIGDPDFDLLRLKADSTGGSITIVRSGTDADAPRIEMRTIPASSVGPGGGCIALQEQGVKVVDITSDSTGGRLSIVGTSAQAGGVAFTADNANGGRIGINTTTPSQALHVVGNICATGTIGACSDARFKDHVETIGDAMTVIEKLRGVDFDWKRTEFADHQFADGKQLGFVAQEVKDVLPMLVSQGSDGYLSVDYGRLTPVLVEAMKQQQKIIDGQKGELSAVKAQLDELQKLVSKLLNEKSNSGTTPR